MATTMLADLDHEMASTRTMLQRIPAAHLDFTPHDKELDAAQARDHLTEFPLWGQVTVQTTLGEQVVMSMPRIAGPADDGQRNGGTRTASRVTA